MNKEFYIKLYKNNKNNKVYIVTDFDTINTTNDCDYETMVSYTDGKLNFVRNFNEFNEKFTIIK